MTNILVIIHINCVECQYSSYYNGIMNKNTIQKLGLKIRVERQKQKISQEKLAELADLNRNFIGLIERGETNVTVKNLENIANALKLDIKDLFIFVI